MNTAFRNVYIIIFITVFSLSPAVLLGQVPSGSRPLVLCNDSVIHKITVYHGRGSGPESQDYDPQLPGYRFDVPRNCVELVNIDPAWKLLQTWSYEVTGSYRKGTPTDIYRDKLPPVPPEGLRDRFWFLRHWVLSILFAVLACSVIFTVGLEGGPAGSGVIPFGCNTIHLPVFLFLAQDWAGGYFYSYLVILSGAMVLSFWAIGAADKKLRIRIIRMAMIGCYIAMFLIINVKTYESLAHWSSGVTQVYVPKQDRNRIEALGKKGEVIAAFTLTKGIDCGTAILWREQTEPRPVSLRIIPPSGTPYAVPVK